MTNVMHKFFYMYLFLFITLYMLRAHRAHHQERQIVSIQPLVTVILCWWPRCVQVGRNLHIRVHFYNIPRLLMILHVVISGFRHVEADLDLLFFDAV